MSLDLSSCWDRPVSNCELDQFYGKPVSETATELAREKVLADVALFADFLAVSDSEREPSVFFGPISTEELARLFLSDKVLTPEQLAAIREDLRARYLAEKAECVETLARGEMQS